ncbi:hypothetical protein J4410_01990 [Candidatus Woesearchaeota archaeon]|nr:hypothetical protein [Candidatus Woesearchaeota archaeon]
MNSFSQQLSKFHHLSFFQRFFFFSALALLIFSIPFAMRFFQGDPFFPGASTYYHMRLITEQHSGFTLTDTALGEPRPFLFTPYHLLFFLISSFLSLSLTFIFLHFFLFCFTFYFLLRLFRFFALPPVHQLLFSVVFFLSPLTLFVYTHIHPAPLYLFLLVFLVWALVEGYSSWLSIFCVVLLPFFGFAPAFIGLLCLLTLGHQRQKIALGVLVIMSILFFSFIGFGYGVPPLMHLTSFSEFFADLGAMQGYSIFTLFLALTGVIVTWRMKKEYRKYYLLAMLGIVVPFFVEGLLFYQNIFISLAASFGFLHLYKRKWSLPSLRFLSLLLVTCGILFTFVSSLSALAASQPSSSFLAGALWIQEKTPSSSLILADSSSGFLISSLAQRTIFLDEQDLFFPSYAQRTQDLAKARSATTLPVLHAFFQNYRITHILFTKAQQEELYTQSFFMLVENTESFKKVYENNLFTLWEYQGGAA